MHDGKDYAILCYIKRSLQNTFIYLLKKKAYNTMIVEFDESVNSSKQRWNHYSNLEMKDVLSRLTKLQREVIFLKFSYGYTDLEIGEAMSISRQAVNRIKNRALAYLKGELESK